MKNDFDIFDPANATDGTVVNLQDIELQIHDILTSYLIGRVDLQTTFARIAPLFEESNSPRAEQVVRAFARYVSDDLTLKQLRRTLEELNEFLGT